jgi:hypothetical protein
MFQVPDANEPSILPIDHVRDNYLVWNRVDNVINNNTETYSANSRLKWTPLLGAMFDNTKSIKDYFLLMFSPSEMTRIAEITTSAILKKKFISLIT